VMACGTSSALIARSSSVIPDGQAIGAPPGVTSPVDNKQISRRGLKVQAAWVPNSLDQWCVGRKEGLGKTYTAASAAHRPAIGSFCHNGDAPISKVLMVLVMSLRYDSKWLSQ
jgi:hypothetical protein